MCLSAEAWDISLSPSPSLTDPANDRVVQLVGAVEEGPEEGPERPLSAREKLLQSGSREQPAVPMVTGLK